jgi:hypothetical protein
MKATLLELLTSKKFLAALAAIIVYVAGRFGLDIDPATLDRVFAALLVYVGAQGAADIGKSAAVVKANAEPALLGARNPESGHARLSVLLVLFGGLLIGAGVGLTAVSCTGAQRAAGAGAFLRCEGEHVDAGLLAEAKGVAISVVEKWLSGAGTVDTTGLRAEAKPLKSDLMRCAFDAAIAALTAAPAKPLPGAPLAAERAVDAQQIRSAWAEVRGELGWPAARGP